MKRPLRASYVGITKFQGSQDGVTYTDIFTVGEEIHEGWNYYSFNDNNDLKYRYYRVYGASKSACAIGELKLRGVEVIDDNNSAYSSCPINLSLNGDSDIAITGTITYSAAKTPLLTAITPRYGQV